MPNSIFLSSYQEINQQDPALSLKEEVKSILRDYRNFWDVHAELIQNSVDAINRRYRMVNDPTYWMYDEFRQQNPNYNEPDFVGKIEIRINTIEKTLTVLDNGVGIQQEKLMKFLLPKYSGKKIKQDYGFKGYGLTFVAFISRFFSVKSKYFTENQAYKYEVSNIFDWIVSDSIPFPNFPDSPVTSEDHDLLQYNTKIEVRFDDDYQRRFDAVAALDIIDDLINTKDDLERFKYILRTKTAIGNTKGLFSLPVIVPIDIKLQVILPDSSIEIVDVPYSYYHPIEHSEVSVLSYEFANYVMQMNAAHFTRGFRCMTHPIISKTIGTRTPVTCNILLSAISSTRLSNIEKNLGLSDINDPSAKISCGIYLSIDGMPTGIRLDSWDKKGGAFKRYYVVVDCNLDISNTLDSGRKGITSHYANLIDEAIVELINSTRIDNSDTFGSYASRDLDIGRGNPSGGGSGFTVPEFQTDVNNALNQIRTDEQQNMSDVEKIRKYSPLHSIPHSEQEVVALFYSLLSQNIIKGYKVIYQAGSEKVYDAAYTYKLSLQGNTQPGDPLGIGQLNYQQLRSQGFTEYDHSQHFAYKTVFPQLCVEFKLNVGGLLYELRAQTNKDPSQIDLLVVWDTNVPPQIPSNSYTLAPITLSQRLYHSSTHRLGILGSRSSELTVISLKDVLATLA